MTEVIHSIQAIRARCDAWRSEGLRVGLVPTMGALHEGHLSLVEAALRAGADRVVVSVFVNPLQFAAGEDLERYPRTLDADVAQVAALGVHVVFAPSPAEMYPEGFQTHVEVTGVTQYLEGAHRPSHFRGVTTVVAKLFNIVGPCVACFGQKDYQQWQVLARMVLDLALPIEVVGCAIVRDTDGLALSSRNRYLSAQQRHNALAIHRGLTAAKQAFEAGQRDAETLRVLVEASVSGSFDHIDYVAIAHSSSLEPVSGHCGARVVLLVAAHLGSTRLIDNLVLGGEDSAL